MILVIDETAGYTDSKMGSCSSWINSGEFWWPFKVGWYAQKLAKNRQKRVKKADFGRFSKTSKCNYTLPVSSISLQLGTNIGLRNANNFIWADFWIFSKNGYFWGNLGQKWDFSYFWAPIAQKVPIFGGDSKIGLDKVVCVPKTYTCAQLQGNWRN